jgi:hypothetical protein
MQLLSSLAVLLAVAVTGTGHPAQCASAVRAIGGAHIDLAPPVGLVEICAEDAGLCRTLTARYPASVTTLGYFVPKSEWDAHKATATAAFTRYFIAQTASSKSPEQLEEVKSFIRAQQADVPDGAHLAERLNAEGQAGLGVFDESPDSISFGAVAKVPNTAGAAEAMLATTNSALVVGHQLLSLYVYLTVHKAEEVSQVEELTRTWLQCLRDANARSGTP